MSIRGITIMASALFAGCLFIGGLATAPHHADAAQPGRDAETIADLKKRVAKLEAEVAEMRKALLRAGGVPDPVSEIKNIREVARLRTADLLQQTRNGRTLVGDITLGKYVGVELRERLNDLSNDLTALWMKMASYGVGREPYLDTITVSGGAGRPSLPPDHGIPGPYASMGLPRLHERFLEAAGIKGKDAEKKNAEFKKLVSAYANAGVYLHRGFGQRVYNDYRQGKELFTPQYVTDLKAVEQWLMDLETVLGKVPTQFERAP